MSVELFSTRFLLLIFLLTGVFSALTMIVLSLGKWISHQRAQVVVAFFLFIQFVLLVWGASVSGVLEAVGWTAEWIPALLSVGAIDVGILENKPSLLIAALPVLLALLSLLVPSRVSDPEDGDRFLLGLVLSSLGAGVAWVGSTAWAVFPALFVTLLGALFGAGKAIQVQKEEKYFGGFLGRQLLGLGVAAAGLAALAGAGATLVFMRTEAVPVSGSLGVFGVAAVLFGAALILGGVPTGLWNEIEGDSQHAGRFILFQIFVGFSVLALISRLEPMFKDAQVFKHGCWFVFVMSALLQVIGLFQRRKASALGIWLVSGCLAAVAALGLGGVREGVLLFLATSLTAYAILVEPRSKAIQWVTLVMGGGFVGTVTASAWLGWISAQLQETAVPGLLVALLFGLRTVLFSKVVFFKADEESDGESVWYSWVPVGAALVLMLALIWQGSIVGGVIPEFSDHVFEGFLGSAVITPTTNQPVALAAFLSSWLIFMSVGVWLAKAQGSFWEKMQDTLPRFTSFILSGFGIDQALFRGMSLLRHMSAAIERGVESRVTNELIPKITEKSVQGVAQFCLRVNEGATAVLEGAIKNAVSAPSQMARLIQNGSIQWYLLFGFLIGMAIFLHFAISAGGN